MSSDYQEAEFEETSRGAPLARTTATGLQVAEQHETSAQAQGAKLAMQVQARYAIAARNPRDVMAARTRLLHECDRYRFAEIARYARPQGRVFNRATQQWEENIIRGPSVRFAESAQRAFGNMSVDVWTTYDDELKRAVRVEVTDYESNITLSKEVTVEKTVERKKLKTDDKGATIPPIGSRPNSYGDTVYLYPATDDEVRVKEEALVSKVRRNLIIQQIPRDIVDDAMDRVEQVLARGIKDDPDAERKRLADAFAGIGIQPDQLADYLGQPIASVAPADLVNLRAVFVAIKDGDVRWADLIAMRAAEGADVQTPAEKAAAAKAAETKAKLTKATERLQAKAAAAKQRQEPAPPAPKAPDDQEPPPGWTPRS